jgi:Icc-related predicted phosphoesterase
MNSTSLLQVILRKKINNMKIVCISDTHTQLDKVNIPDGDILIHAGDLTYRGNVQEISKELFELYKYKNKFDKIIVCAGNHDWLAEKSPQLMKDMCDNFGITYLSDSGTEVKGIKFWGSPWQIEFNDWAFNLPSGQPLKEKWDLIPDDTDVLITHSPPLSILDYIEEFNPRSGVMSTRHLGCIDLYERIQKLNNLKLHVFGHIHFSHGSNKIENVTFVNASVCTEQYKPINLPITVIL